MLEGAEYDAEAPLTVSDPRLGVNDQVTSAFDALLTDAAKLTAPEGYSDAADGVTVTETGAGTTVKGRMLLLPADVTM